MPTLTLSEHRSNVPRDLRPSERRPSPPMLASLKRAAELARGFQGEPWVRTRHGRTAAAMVRRELASEYRVTEGGQVFYRATSAGLALVGAR